MREGGVTRQAGEPLPRVIPARRAAFTMVELLVVIVIIILLTGLIAGVASKAIENQRITVTKNTMRTIDLAIQQFAGDNPLGTYYNSRRTNSVRFGPYPPYQLFRGVDGTNTVAWAVDPSNPDTKTLERRLARDLFNINASSSIPSNRIEIETDAHDDIRALYAYLRLFNPAALNQIPQEARKALSNIPNKPEYVNTGSTTDAESRSEVLGFHDAWGVPLDYFLVVRLEWGLVPSPTPGLPPVPGLLVRDRVPVLRSHGVSSEIFAEYERTKSSSSPRLPDAKKAIYSQPFPSPKANVDPDTGLFSGGTSGNGWARAKAAGNKKYYEYIPQ